MGKTINCMIGEAMYPVYLSSNAILCHILDFSQSFPNRSLTGVTDALIRKQHTTR